MGARRIVYIGLEQRANLRFFDSDDALRERIISDLVWVSQNGFSNRVGT
jgi:hypothetical protein